MTVLNCISNITEEVHNSRQPQTCYINTEGEGVKKKKETQKATLVSSYLDATTSNAGSDKVTASKSSENPLCNTFNHTAWHNVDPPDVTKEESSRAGEKQKEESGGGGNSM